MRSANLHTFSWDRMIAAVEAVRVRARRIAATLNGANIPYAIIGDNAIAAWVARVDPEVVRNAKNVEVLIRRVDLSRVIEAGQSNGFISKQVHGIDLLLDGPDGSVRSAIHLVFANEKVRGDNALPAPDVTASVAGPEFTFATLEALVQMKLTSFRLNDQVHLMDLLEVGLIDASWCDRFPPELAERLREVIRSKEREA